MFPDHSDGRVVHTPSAVFFLGDPSVSKFLLITKRLANSTLGPKGHPRVETSLWSSTLSAKYQVLITKYWFSIFKDLLRRSAWAGRFSA
jgi:hypothetical protein